MRDDNVREAWMWLLIVALIFTIGITKTCDGQVFCDECPPVGGTICELYPDACAQCWEECVDRPPPLDYYLPRGVGVTQVNHELGDPEPILQHFTSKELFDELEGYDIRTVQLWIKGDPFDGAGEWGEDVYDMGTDEAEFEDMDEVWTHPAIDVIIVRFQSMAWTTVLPNRGIWCEYPLELLARKLLTRYYDEDKVIIFADWEADNRWQMGVPAGLEEERFGYVMAQLEQRQLAIEKVRAEFPFSALKLYHVATINDTRDGDTVASAIIPNLVNQPDFIGISYQNKHDGKSLGETVDYVRDVTGYPAHRIIIVEVGAMELSGAGPSLPWWCDDPFLGPIRPDCWTLPGEEEEEQYDLLMEAIPEAFDRGVQVAVVWMWRQTWHHFRNNGKPKNWGMWEWSTTEGKVEFSGLPNSGLRAITELNDEY